MNLNVSKSTINRIANKLGKECRLGLLNNQKPKFYRRRHVATPATVRRITSYISKENPPTISLMATDLNVHGKTRLHFIERGSTITSRYYIEHIIEPFIKYVIPRLFSGDTRKKMILHQDSAPGHTAKWTVSYMKEKKIQVMTPAEWLTKSSDTAPMDYSIWSILKERVRKRKMSTLNGLKNAIKQEWENLEQDVIDYALEN
ncbi:unnamed protein product [Rotaria sp. Silwood2]|nr:unnamed protein product [Rotaria sp. Silwood2]CAF2679217.1 unnamed protein product [Rotaria sp. Silwood2]CAF3992870.1 unnamed protein product [Rotaria sp. Silwood2]CAF4042571.1 unnamed protein product [Rotaria sp. Silwood2]CAF4478939.1 unnamed protein product [Rotaria sp. Silwood2]